MNWLKQANDKPLFPDVLWNRPENKRHAGKLMIAGGHAQSFSTASRAFLAASKAGAGTVRILLPDSLQKTVGRAFPEAEFAPSTPIGSFSRRALDDFLDLAAWSDGVLLAGDISKNSETAVLLENFALKYSGLLCMAGDSIDYFYDKSSQLSTRPSTVVVTELSKLQKLVQPAAALKQRADLSQVVNDLAAYTTENRVEIITEHKSNIIVATGGQVSTTKVTRGLSWEDLAAYISIWRLQQPDKPFESLTTAVYCYVS